MAVSRGTLICESQPFVYALSSKCRGCRCDYCFKWNENLHRCNRCQFMYYCDRNCQKNAWKEHKHECGNIKKVYPRRPAEFVLMISRVIYKLKTQTDRGEKVGEIVRYFQDLESHKDEIRNDRQRVYELNVFWQVLTDFLPPEDLPPFSELLEIFGRIIINCYTISDEEMSSIGVGLYLGASIFNHSCQPNATLVFDGPKIFVYAIESIPSLDHSKIFVPYIDLLATTEERRKELQSAYYFHCICDKCQNVENDNELLSIKCVTPNCEGTVIINDGSTICSKCGNVTVGKEVIKSSSAAMKLCADSLKELRDLKTSNQNEVIVQRTKKILKSAFAFLHPLNIHYVRIVDFAIDANFEIENFSRALELAKFNLPAYRKCYGPFHPILGLTLLKIGKLQLYFKRLSDAKATLLEAARIINSTHSQSHPLRATCCEFLEQLNSIR